VLDGILIGGRRTGCRVERSVFCVHATNVRIDVVRPPHIMW
jgi:hypothetical protein